MKKEISTSQIQSLLREGVPQSELAANYELDEKLLESFAKMVNIEKEFAIEELKSYDVIFDQNRIKFYSLVNEAGAKYGEYGAKPIWLATKKGHEPWNIEISISSTITLLFSWKPATYELKSLNDYSSQLLQKGFIEPTNKVSEANLSEAPVEIVEEVNELISENDIMADYNPFAAGTVETDNQALTEIIDLATIKEEASKQELPKKEELPKPDKPESKESVKEKKSKNDNATTSIEDAEVGKGKVKKAPSERIPVPSWDDIILGGK